MALINTFLDSIGQAFCEKGRRALIGELTYGDVMADVARVALDYLRKHGPTEDIQHALEDVASSDDAAYRAHLDKMIERLSQVQPVPFKEVLVDYLLHLPSTVRQMFRRPSDPTGRTGADKLEFYKPEQLLSYLPPRRSHFRAGTAPEHLDNWKLAELRGLGECSEVWLGRDTSDAAEAPSALKFAIDPETATRIRSNQDLFVKVFNLNEVNGIVPLRAVYLDSELPCLESTFVYGYDLTGLMNEWKWRFDAPKPEAAMKIVRRLAEIIGRAHAQGIVHRDLKPSNVLVHPGEGGKFTLWITDFGWGQIEAERSLEMAKHGETSKCEQLRLSYRGAYTPLYASPQQHKHEQTDTRDDVHALGVIWYQLLKRDPHVAAPVGDDWAEEFARHGFTPSQAKLLSACVATRADRRPGDAKALADLLKVEAVSAAAMAPAIEPDGSRLISLTNQSTAAHKPVVTLRGKTVEPDAAAAAAAALLGGGGIGGKYGTRPTVPGTGGSGSKNFPALLDKTADGKPRLVRNSLGMTFVHIPPGTFNMGATDEEAGRKQHETPRHPVRIAQGFYMSIHPVTQGQYEKLKGKNPSFFHKVQGGGGDLPVDSVTWHDAEKFCQKLSQLADETLAERTYRLPTEAEWEYACRSGTGSPYWCGAALSAKEAHFKSAAGGQGQPHAVGRSTPNAWGLHDMHGNIDEWCGDWYHEYYYFDSPGNDPSGPAKGEKKVVRGGSWADGAADCRSAARKAMNPSQPFNTVGFRVLLVAK